MKKSVFESFQNEFKKTKSFEEWDDESQEKFKKLNPNLKYHLYSIVLFAIMQKVFLAQCKFFDYFGKILNLFNKY